MKLNNRGWGNRELIVSCCIIFFLLLVIIFNVGRLYRSMEESLSTDTTKVSKKNNTNNNTTNNSTNNNTNNNTTNNSTNNNTTNDNYDNYTTDTTTDNNYDLGEIDLEYYKNSEDRLKEASRKYIIDNNLQLNEVGQMLDLSTLINANYINDIRDLNDNSICAGYSFIAMDTDNSIIIRPYVSCTSYTTEGY